MTLDPETMNREQLLDYCYGLEARLESAGQMRSIQEVAHLQGAFGLTMKEATILGTLSDGLLHTKENLHLALYANDPDGGAEIKIIDVFICRLRQKIGGAAQIETVWGVGYRVKDPTHLKAVMCGETPPGLAESVAESRQKPKGAMARAHGEVRDAALRWLASKRGSVATAICTSNEFGKAAGLKTNASGHIGNLARGGYIEIVRRPPAKGDSWVLALTPKGEARL